MGNQQSGSSSKGKSSKFHGGGQSTGYKPQQVPICSVTLRSWHIQSWEHILKSMRLLYFLVVQS